MSIILETARLRLRRFTPGDADLLVELDNDPEVMRYLTGGRPTPRAVIEGELLPKIIREYAESPGLGRWAAFAARRAITCTVSYSSRVRAIVRASAWIALSIGYRLFWLSPP